MTIRFGELNAPTCLTFQAREIQAIIRVPTGINVYLRGRQQYFEITGSECDYVETLRNWETAMMIDRHRTV